MEMDNVRVIAINPGSTSTKIAVFQNDKAVFLKTIKHTAEDLAPFPKIPDQFQFRKNIILQQLAEAGINLEQVKVVVGRGGVLKPIPSGVYEVNEAMIHDLIHSETEHASNLGGLIANDIAKSIKGARAFIADPVVVDEFHDLARISGHPFAEPSRGA